MSNWLKRIIIMLICVALVFGDSATRVYASEIIDEQMDESERSNEIDEIYESLENEIGDIEESIIEADESVDEETISEEELGYIDGWNEPGFPLQWNGVKKYTVNQLDKNRQHGSYLSSNSYTSADRKITRPKQPHSDYMTVDIKAAANTPIYAVDAGTVIESGKKSGNGYYVVIYHPSDGSYSYYGHMCSHSELIPGNSVGKGNLVGYVGNTGYTNGFNHLHFEWTKHDPYCTYYEQGFFNVYTDPNRLNDMHNHSPISSSTWYMVNSSVGLDLNSGDNYTTPIWEMPNGATVEYLGLGTNGRYKVRYWNLVGYCASNFLVATSEPVKIEGYTDSVSSSAGKLSVRGWAFDRSNFDANIRIDVYIDNSHLGSCLANTYKSINGTYPGLSDYHGFNTTFNTSYTGKHRIDIYAISANGDSSRKIYSEEVDIKSVTKPVISSAYIRDVDTYDGTYVVEANIISSAGVSRVQFPTWTLGGSNPQDDLAPNWQVNSSVTGSVTRTSSTMYKAVYTVKVADHNYERGLYTTHIYAYDDNGYVSDSYVNLQNVNMAPRGERTVTDGKYAILSCYDLDLRLASSGNETPKALDNVQMYYFDALSDNAKAYFDVRYIGDGYYEIFKGDCALEVHGSSTTSGCNVLLGTRNNSDAQKWIIDKLENGNYGIRAKCNGFSLDMAELTTPIYEANVTTNLGHKGVDQQWRFLPLGANVSNGKYYIVSAIDDSYVLSASNGGRFSDICIKENKNEANQIFDLNIVSSGVYEIRMNDSCLTVENGNTESGTNVILEYFSPLLVPPVSYVPISSKDKNVKCWTLKDEGNGYFSIISLRNALAVDVQGATAYQNANVFAHSYHGEENQLWRLVPYNTDEKNIEIPEIPRITGTCGSLLSSIQLPDGFSWMDSPDTVIYATGNTMGEYTTHKAKYTDGESTRENIDVRINISHEKLVYEQYMAKNYNVFNGGYVEAHKSHCINNDNQPGGIINSNPTYCHSSGIATCSQKAICDVCKFEMGNYDYSNHTGTHVIKDKKVATCYEHGYTGDEYCNSCDKIIFLGEETPLLAHQINKVVIENQIISTCIREGSYDEVVYCAEPECRKELSRTRTIIGFEDHLDLDDDGLCDSCGDAFYKDGLWIKEIVDQLYTGKVIRPEVKVYDGNKQLEVNKDYSIAFAKNINAGDAVITVRGKGNYSSVETECFKILPQDISGGLFRGDTISVQYNGKALKPVPVLLWKGVKVVPTKNYSYEYYKADINNQPISEALPSVSDPGNYIIRLSGMGNFTGTRDIRLIVTDNLKLISRATVSKIPAISYNNGEAIVPYITVKYGRDILVEGTDYIVSYENNNEVGKAAVVIEGIGSYTGTKRVNFNIIGTAITKAMAEGIATAVDYTGNDIIFESLSLYLKATRTTSRIDLVEGRDYKVSYLNNQKVGVGTVVFTGINGYTGALKKTFRINAFKSVSDIDRFNVLLDKNEVEYSKGGAKPKITVTFSNDDGTTRILNQGTDYTLIYTNNTAVNDGSNALRLPTVKVNFRGNYSGFISKNYTIIPKDIAHIDLVANDKAFLDRKGAYKTTLLLTDIDGKRLVVNRDYSSNVSYSYKDDTVVNCNGVKKSRVAGETVNEADIIPAGTSVVVKVAAKEGGNYIGVVVGEYRITKSTITGARITIPPQDYTGKALEPKIDVITAKIGTTTLVASEDFEVVPGSYSNNTNKGTASVTIRGIGNYGGTKKVNFTIRAKGFTWWWR